MSIERESMQVWGVRFLRARKWSLLSHLHWCLKILQWRQIHSYPNQSLNKMQRRWKSISKIKFTMSSKWLTTTWNLVSVAEGGGECLSSSTGWSFTGGQWSGVNEARTEVVGASAKFFLFGCVLLLTIADGTHWVNSTCNEKDAGAQGGNEYPRHPVPSILAWI